MQQQLSAQVLHVAGLPAELVSPYSSTMERCTAADKAKAVDNCQEEIKQRTIGLVPQVRWPPPWWMAPLQEVMFAPAPPHLAPMTSASGCIC